MDADRQQKRYAVGVDPALSSIGGSPVLLSIHRTFSAVLLAVVATVFLVGCAQGPKPGVGPVLSQDGVTTIYAVRHAEKEDGEDPGLTVQGQRRAMALAEMLGDDDIAAVFSTEYLRTRKTVEPLARALGQTVIETPARDPAGLADRILEEYAGMAVVAAAHSNTVPTLLTALGVDEVITLTDSEYGDLFVVVVGADGAIDFSRHRFGD